MQIPITEEFVEIAKAIVASNRSLAQWAELESDDEFQTKQYCGGFDADEQAFCFSYYSDLREFWFQVSLEQAESIARGQRVELSGRRANCD